MKEDLQVLLQLLCAEQQTLERQKGDLMHQLDTAVDSRRSTARRCIRNLLPNLESDTISSLRRTVPDLEIPMVSAWFGFSKKLDPNVTIDTLRMQLGTYLDNSPNASREWVDSVGRLDQTIRDLQENSIPENAAGLDEMNAKIEAIKKLSVIDPSKMSPEIHKKLEQTIASARKTGGRSVPFRSVQKTAGVASYPTRSQINSDSGPGLLEMWLWYQLLTPNSEYSHETQLAFVGGGGETGGAGAGGSWGETKEAPEVSSGPVVSENIEPQYALGAASFS